MVQQSIEHDFRDDDNDACIRIDAAIAGHKADVVGAKTPATKVGA